MQRMLLMRLSSDLKQELFSTYCAGESKFQTIILLKGHVSVFR